MKNEIGGRNENENEKAVRFCSWTSLIVATLVNMSVVVSILRERNRQSNYFLINGCVKQAIKTNHIN